MKCYYCKKPAINNTEHTIIAGCEAHEKKAKDKDVKEKAFIRKNGFKKWLNKK